MAKETNERQQRDNMVLYPTAYAPFVPRSLSAAGKPNHSPSCDSTVSVDRIVIMESMYQSHYPNEPDWAADEELLYSKCCEAIARFTAEHPDEVCSFLAFDSEPSYSYAIVALDTRENEIKESNRSQDYEIQNRIKQFAHENAWQKAHYFVAERQSHAHCRSSGSFAYAAYEHVEFEKWEDFLDSFMGDLPPEDAPEYDEAESKAIELHSKYLEGHVILIFWKVIERLIEEGEINKLNLASPFRLGYNFHDQGLITVVRIINWPQSAV
jgi:hypothetical protein